MSKQGLSSIANYFRVLGVLSLGSIFLPILFSRLPSPFHTPTTYFFLWLLSLAILKKDVLLDKLLLRWLLFIVIFTLLGYTIWAELNIGGNTKPGFMTTIKLLGFFYFAMIIRTYFIKSNDIYGLIIVVKFGLLFILITSITSIIGLTLHPAATRIMASHVATTESNTYFYSIGIGKYGFFASLVYLMPVLVLAIKRSSFTIKVILIIYSLIVLFSLVKAEFTTALALAATFFVFSFFSFKGFGKTLIVAILMYVFIFIMISGFLSDIFVDLSHLFSKNSAISNRLIDISDLFAEKDFNPDSADNYAVRVRFKLVIDSFISFLETPIFGKAFQAGKFGAFHSHFIDWLAYFGLLGGIPLFYLIITSFKTQIKINSYKTTIILSLISFFILGILTTSSETPQSAFSILFIIPGVFYILEYNT